MFVTGRRKIKKGLRIIIGQIVCLLGFANMFGANFVSDIGNIPIRFIVYVIGVILFVASMFIVIEPIEEAFAPYMISIIATIISFVMIMFFTNIVVHIIGVAVGIIALACNAFSVLIFFDNKKKVSR